MKDAKFVWDKTDGQQRQQFLDFLLEVSLSAPVEECEASLFADHNYQFFVNGRRVAVGPARFYPDQPAFDRLDLAEFLKNGRNVLACRVYHSGLDRKTHERSRGGFIFSGCAKMAGGGRVDLSTPGGWVFREVAGYTRDAPFFSFALPPVEIRDTRLYDDSCLSEGAIGEGWGPVTPVKNPSAWGQFRQSLLPLPLEEVVEPQGLKCLAELRQDQDLHSLRVPFFDVSKGEHGMPDNHPASQNASAFAWTWIYSAKNQDVDVELTSAIYWLNGQKLQVDTSRQMWRQQQTVRFVLREGWNFLFVIYDRLSSDWHYYEMVFSTWEFALRWSSHAELIVSAEKEPSDTGSFCVAGPIRLCDPRRAAAEPVPADLPPVLHLPVRQVKTQGIASSPAQDVDWAEIQRRVSIPHERGELSLSSPSNLLIWDFGGTRSGRFFVEMTTAQGAVLSMAYADQWKAAKDRPQIMATANGIEAGDRWISRGGRQLFETFLPRGCRFLAVKIDSPQPAVIHHMGVRTQRYAFSEKSEFSCSDEIYNRLWDKSKVTLRICTDDAFMDTPWRERGLFGGDAFVEQAIALATSGDTLMGRHCAELLAHTWGDEIGWMQTTSPHRRSHPTPLLDYPLLTLIMAAALWRQSRDKTWLSRITPWFEKLLESAHQQADDRGLFWNFCRPFIDHTPTGINREIPCSCALNCVYSAGLDAFAKLQEGLGNAQQARVYTRRAEQVRVATREAFWDESAGCFADGLIVGGLCEGRHPHSSSWAIYFGVASEEQTRRIIPHITAQMSQEALDKDRFASPYGAFYHLGAFYKAGAYAQAEDLMRRGWKNMVEADGDTLWEAFRGDSSHSHAWSGGPAFYFATEILGIPLGYPWGNPELLVIRPSGETLDRASGTIPHATGDLTVRWEIRQRQLLVQTKTSGNVKLEVQPRGRLKTYELVHTYL